MARAIDTSTFIEGDIDCSRKKRLLRFKPQETAKYSMKVLHYLTGNLENDLEVVKEGLEEGVY